MASIPDNSEKMISSTLPRQESMLSVLWTKIDQATYVVGPKPICDTDILLDVQPPSLPRDAH